VRDTLTELKAVLLAASGEAPAAGKLKYALPHSTESELAAIASINVARLSRSRRDITRVRQSRAASRLLRKKRRL
jgi:hypothetical protein